MGEYLPRLIPMPLREVTPLQSASRKGSASPSKGTC